MTQVHVLSNRKKEVFSVSPALNGVLNLLHVPVQAEWQKIHREEESPGLFMDFAS